MDPMPASYNGFQEPEYDEWPEVDEALLAQVRASLQLNLSSVLNNPSAPLENLFHASDLTIAPRPDLPDLEYDELASFYGHLRPLMSRWTAAGGGIRPVPPEVDAPALPRTDDFATALAVPPVFFSRTFSVATDVCAGEDTLNPFLQQKLSHYLDVVEMELVSQTSRRSRSFFAALTQMRELHAQVTRAVERIQVARANMARLEDSLVRSAVAIPQLRRRRANLDALFQQLTAVDEFRAASTQIDTLIAHSQYADAIEVLHTQQQALSGPKLRGVALLADEIGSVSERLDRLGARMETELLECVLAPDFNHTAMERVCVGALEGLHRLGRLTAVWQTLRERNVVAVKALLRQVLRSRPRAEPERVGGRPPPPLAPAAAPGMAASTTDATDDDEEDLAALRTLKTNDWLALLQRVYTSCLERLDKLRYLCELLALVVAAPDLTAETLQSLCELLQLRVVRVLKARADENARLPLDDFASLFEGVMAFAAASEKLAQCTTQCYSLRGCIVTQAKAFLDAYNKNQVRQLTAVLDGERWVTAEVPMEFQQYADALCGVDTLPRPDEGGAALTSSNGNLSWLLVGGRKYHVVNAALMCVRAVWEFAQCARRLPHLAVDMIAMVRRLFKLYNSKSAMLILGAEAMHGAAGLKSITTKHLGLCTESVAAVGALIPPVVRLFTSLLPPAQHVLLEDFTTVAQEFENLRTDIHAKLVSIMRDTLAAYLERMRGQVVEWGAFPDKVSDYVGGLADKTHTLYRLLAKILQHDHLERLFGEILDMYNAKLAEVFRTLDLPTRNARLRLQTDVRALCDKLGHFDGITATLGTTLVQEFVVGQEAALTPANSKKPAEPLNIDIEL